MILFFFLLQKKKFYQEELQKWKRRERPIFYNLLERGWRVSSRVKSTCCSYKGPGLGFQHPHGLSQASITLVPGDLMYSSGFLVLWAPGMYTVHIHTFEQNTHTCQIEKYKGGGI